MGPAWTDSHCHLDAPEFDADRADVVQRARAAGVRTLVLPSVAVAHFDAVRDMAHRHDTAYALGIHPLFVGQADDADLERLAAALRANRDDPRLVAVGEIGLDHFVPATGPERPLALVSDRARQLALASDHARQLALACDRARQEHFYLAQLKLARDAGLPVILHVRRSADALLAGLRRIAVPGGIAHAFNGSAVQAAAFVALGFRLGFGGTLSFERALQIRQLAQTLPETALVLETDAPDIPPQWLYRSAAARRAGQAQARNEPAELPRIGAVLAGLRGWTLDDTARITSANARAALPRLAAAVDR